MSDELTIRYVPLSTVQLWERNPKLHHLGDLAASIERYGFKEIPKYEPALNSGQGGIVAGNGRIETLAALHQQGKPAPRGIIEQDGEWLVPVTFGVDAASQEEAEAYGLDSNNLGLSGGDFTAFDMARLWSSDYTDILAGLATADALPITVDGDALDGLLKAMEPEIVPGDGGDDFDARPEEGPTRTATGDLWRITGNGIEHRLLVGDCTDPANVARLMGGERADMVWTDPPYGVEIVGGTHNPYLPSFQSGGRIENDNLSEEDLEALLHAAFGNIYAHCRDGGVWYVAAPAGPLHLVFGKVLRHLKIWHQTLQWLKHAFVFGRNDYHYRNEPIFYGWKPGAAHYFTDDRTQDTIWEFDRPGPTDKAHPTVKPIGLVERAIRNSMRDGELVADPFLGSGTTLIAAHRTGRRCYGCEISPKYADVILRRASAEGLHCERAE